jgi:hypothetical protein
VIQARRLVRRCFHGVDALFGSFWPFLSLCQIAREPPRPTQSRVASSDARGKKAGAQQKLDQRQPFRGAMRCLTWTTPSDWEPRFRAGFLLSRTSLQDARANRTELLRHMRSATAEIVIEPGVRGWLVRIHWPRGAPTKLSFSTEQAARNWAKTASSDWIANHPRHGRPQSRPAARIRISDRAGARGTQPRLAEAPTDQ